MNRKRANILLWISGAALFFNVTSFIALWIREGTLDWKYIMWSSSMVFSCLVFYRMKITLPK